MWFMSIWFFPHLGNKRKMISLMETVVCCVGETRLCGRIEWFSRSGPYWCLAWQWEESRMVIISFLSFFISCRWFWTLFSCIHEASFFCSLGGRKLFIEILRMFGKCWEMEMPGKKRRHSVVILIYRNHWCYHVKFYVFVYV